MNNIERKYFKPLIPMAKIHLGQFLNRNYLVNSNHCRPHAMELNEKFEFAKKKLRINSDHKAGMVKKSKINLPFFSDIKPGRFRVQWLLCAHQANIPKI